MFLQLDQLMCKFPSVVRVQQSHQKGGDFGAHRHVVVVSVVQSMQFYAKKEMRAGETFVVDGAK